MPKRPSLIALVLRGLPVALSMLCTVVFSSPAEACSCTPAVTINQAVPADGATNVPVNVVPWVRSRGEVNLLDPEGTVVETVKDNHTARTTLCIFTKDLRPVEPLKPNTTYRLHFEPDSVTGQGTLTETSFTTGNATLDANDEHVELRSAVFDVGAAHSTCVTSRFQACIDSGHREELIDVRVLDGESQLIHYVDFASNLRNLELGAGQDEGRADCIEVRARNLAGQTSAPARTCFALGEVPSMPTETFSTPSDTRHFPECDTVELRESDAQPGPGELESGSCALVAPASRSSGLATGLALLGLGLVAARRRV